MGWARSEMAFRNARGDYNQAWFDPQLGCGGEEHATDGLYTLTKVEATKWRLQLRW